MDEVRLSDEQRIAWLRLIRTENVGPITFRSLLNRFGSADAALEALPRLVQRGGARSVAIPSRARAEDEIAALSAANAQLVALGEPGYPPHLTQIPGPPPLLAVIGAARAVTARRTIAMVGARNASAAGRRMAQMLSRQLGAEGFVVVSGLARGIDAAAHEASLESGTVAVLAGGLDRIYPEENRPLAQSILDHGGALVSEMPLGWEPRSRDFPRRNRLVSGLSLGVVVIEAAQRSGSLITARMALEQNREVFAVPGFPLDPRAEGGNRLIQDGAKLTTRAADVLEELEGVTSVRPPLAASEPDLFEGLDEAPEPATGDRDRLVVALSITPTSVDTLIEQTGLPAASIGVLLLELELAGRIERLPNQLVALAG